MMDIYIFSVPYWKKEKQIVTMLRPSVSILFDRSMFSKAKKYITKNYK